MDGEHERGSLGDGLEVVQLGVESEIRLGSSPLEPQTGRFEFLGLPLRDIGGCIPVPAPAFFG